MPEKLTFTVTDGHMTDHMPYFVDIGPNMVAPKYSPMGRLSFKGGQSHSNLRVGYALPMYGTIYRVVHADSWKLELARVPDEDIPDSLKLHDKSYSIPLGSSTPLHRWRLSVKDIAIVDGKPTVEIAAGFPGHSMSGTYHVGDSINSAGHLFRILNIVPPQDRFVGWIEIDSNAEEGPVPPTDYTPSP